MSTTVTMKGPSGRTVTLDEEARKRPVTLADAAIGDFVASEELRAVAERLIDRHLMFAAAGRHPIAYLLDRRKEPSTKSGIHALAEARLVPKLWRELAGVEAAIVVRRVAWDSLTDHQREALVHHELMHLDENEKGALVLRDHDLEEFGATVRAYGQWMPDVEHFAEQLRLFDEARDAA